MNIGPIVREGTRDVPQWQPSQTPPVPAQPAPAPRHEPEKVPEKVQ
jgi:hypothetical protein